MRYLLGTNVCIQYLNGSSPAILHRLEGARRSEVFLCAVVKAELLFCAAKSLVSERTRSKLARFFSAFESLPFDDDAAEAYARVRAQQERQGTPIGSNDLMIASIALSRGATLVTANRCEFSRVQGLAWEDWDATEERPNRWRRSHAATCTGRFRPLGAPLTESRSSREVRNETPQIRPSPFGRQALRSHPKYRQ